MKAPFSVLISVWKESVLSEFQIALESIWIKQILQPSQIVIVIDGDVSEDLLDYIEAIRQQDDSLFTIKKLENNLGLASCLNIGLKLCRYDIVARMDADDVSLPERFEKQFKYLALKSEIAVLGTQVDEWNQSLTELKMSKRLPLKPKELYTFGKWRCPLNHPTVMYRKRIIEAVGGYPLQYPEDYALWGKLLVSGHILENLPEVLVKMRVDDHIAKRRGWLFLKGELRTYKLFFNLGYVSLPEFLINCGMRTFLRLSPKLIKKILYICLR